MFRKIESLIRARKFDEAERTLEARAPDGSPGALSYFRLGKLFFENQEWRRSTVYFQKSIALDNHNDEAHLLLGLAWRELKNPEAAEAEILEAERVNPGSAVNAYLAGHQLLLNRKFEAALPHLYQAIKLNPRNPDAFRALGMVQARLGNLGLAESYYRKSVALADEAKLPATAARMDLAFLLLLGHDSAKLAEGLKLARLVVQGTPASSPAHFLVGKALFKLGNYREAIPELQEAARLSPEDSKPHFLLAQAFDRMGDPRRAQAEREALAKTKKRSSQTGIAAGEGMPGSTE